MSTMTTERPHGYTRYKLDGCRCYVCGFANSEYCADRERAIAYGTWKPFVDAEPVREHIRMLSEAGIGWKRVAALAGLSSGSLSKLLFGVKSKNRPPAARIRTANAAKVMAVRPGSDVLADGALVDAVGTVRRLQALVRRGWPQSQLAERLGMTPGNFGTMLDYEHVTAGKARLVADLYRRLENQDPAAHGVGQAGITRAVRYGTARAWPLPAMWDDDRIDDPQAFPDWTGECGDVKGYAIHHRDGIPYCGPCREAMRLYGKAQREAKAAMSP